VPLGALRDWANDNIEVIIAVRAARDDQQEAAALGA
jgi:hypothetical protein